MDFLAPLHSGGTVLNYANRPVVSGDLVSITGNETQGNSIYAIVKVKPPQDYVTYIDGSDSELSTGYYYRVVEVRRVWLGFNPDISGWRVELTKDKVETFLNANEGQGTWALHQPGNLTPSDLGIPPSAEAEDQTFDELSDGALSSITGAYGLSWDYDTSSNFTPSIKLWYPGNADENGDGNGGITTLQDNNGDIGEAFIAQVKALKRKLTDGIVELGFDTLDLKLPARSYNYGVDFFTAGGIRSLALQRSGKWNITLAGQTSTIDGPGVLTGISDVAGAQDGRVFKYYKNNLGHIEGVRFMENYYSIPTINLSNPVSEYVNHVLDLDAESSLDGNTAIIAGLDGMTSLLKTLASAKYENGAVSNALTGGFGPLIPSEYQSTLGFAIAASLGLTSLKTAYQKKLQLSGVSGALVKSTVCDVSYGYKTAKSFNSIPDLSSFTVSSSTLFKNSTVTDFSVERMRSASPIEITYLGPRDVLSEGLAYVSNGFYVRAA